MTAKIANGVSYYRVTIDLFTDGQSYQIITLVIVMLPTTHIYFIRLLNSLRKADDI